MRLIVIYLPLKNKKLERLYKRWIADGILSDIATYKVYKILKKKNISNLEVLTATLDALYFKQDNDIDETELFNEVAKSSYDLGCEECKGKVKKNKHEIELYIAALIILPNKTNGNIWKEYMEDVSLYNSTQIKRQVLINLQQGNELNVDNFEVSKDINIQQKR